IEAVVWGSELTCGLAVVEVNNGYVEVFISPPHAIGRYRRYEAPKIGNVCPVLALLLLLGPPIVIGISSKGLIRFQEETINGRIQGRVRNRQRRRKDNIRRHPKGHRGDSERLPERGFPIQID